MGNSQLGATMNPPSNGSEMAKLADLLYSVQRRIESDELLGKDKKPVFILVAKDMAARQIMECKVLDYFYEKYGAPNFLGSKGVPYDINPLDQISMFHFAEHGVCIGLIDATSLHEHPKS